MRFGVAIPQAGRFVRPEVQRRVAHTLEGEGWDSLWVSDHVIVPVGESYIPEVIHEPLALLPWLAGVTTDVTLGISVLVVPYRDPVFTAAHLASVDVLSEGRLVVGVGVGWLEREFEALSADHANRGAVTDEYLRVIRNLWETDTSSFEGERKRYTDMRLFPKKAASREGTIPLVVGGNTGPGIRRAAELGDGWHPINLSPEQLRDGIARYHEACRAAGRPAGPVSHRFMPPDPSAMPDPAAYADAGCDELVVSLPIRDVDELLEALARVDRSP